MVDKPAENGIAFKFIPPRPTSGDYGTARGTQFKILELQTVFYQVAAIMNSRPLTSLHADPDTTDALTPVQFLSGRSFSAIPMENNDITATAQVRWKRVQS
uniref:Uncharacterized protein n=1 Tax=Anopheles funestus TaxID=62324 RepID=A0A182S0B4_ANOFN